RMSDRWLRYRAFWGSDPKRDVDDEIQFHLEERVADLVSRGASLEDARARAAREFGDASVVRNETIAIDERMIRRHRRGELLGSLLRDARVGLRALAKTPTFTATAVLCAALGIGTTGAILSATYAVLIR